MKLHNENINFGDELTKLEKKVEFLIAENKKLVHQLKQAKESEKNANYLIDAIPLPLFTTDEFGNINFINAETKELLEMNHSSKLPSNIFEVLSHDDAKLARENFAKILLGENLPPNVYTAYTNTKKEIKLIVKSKRYYKNESTSGLVGTILDASKEKETVNYINETEQRYKRLIEQSEDAIFLLNDKKMKLINSGFTRMFEFSKDDVVRGDFDLMKIVSKTSYLEMKTVMSELKHGQKIKHLCEFTAINSNGNLIDCEVSLVSFIYKNENYIQGIIRNISKRKTAERELLKTKSFLQAAIEQSPAGIMIIDALTKEVRIANQAALDIFGYDENSSKNAAQLFEKFNWQFLTNNGELLNDENDPLNCALSRGDFFKNEEALIFDSLGNQRWLSINAAPIFDSTKEIVAGVMVLMDISEQKLAEQEIRRSEELFRGLYENASVGIFRISRDGKQNVANPALLNLLGYRNEKELLTDFRKRRLISLEEFISYLETQCALKDKCIIERNFMKLCGEEVDFKIVVRRIEEVPGEKYYYEGVVEDITMQKAAEQALINAKENAEKSDRLKSEFLAQMSHEIRTPINTILSFSSLVEEDIADKVSDDLGMSFDYIYRSGNRIIRTIDLILHMSELQTGTYEFVESTFDIYSDVLENLYPEYLMTAREKGIKFSITNETNDPIVQGDKSSISRIFSNLIDNALKYTKEGGVNVRITQTPDSKVMVEVNDTGIGIAETYLDSLFKPFTQEDQGYTRKFEGNGLGLALVSKYIELNNAKIEVESEKGKGSCFKVVFN